IVDSVLTGQNGGLLNRWCWVDFELRLLFRGNGLLRFQVGSDQMGHIGFGQPGYYLDLATGSLHSAEGMVLGKATGSWPSEGWHSLTLTASQGILGFSADNGSGAEISNADSPLKGRIGIDATGEGLHVRHVRIRPLNQKSLRNIPADNYYCYVCHANFEYEDPLVEVHMEADVGCAECHGPSLAHRSDEDNVTPPDIIYRRPQVDSTCVKCHDRHEEKEAPGDRTLPVDRICTDCHGDHRAFD
ncbi:MAG TPA: cytochrome c3 family protein, partial [Acidobacteriota bacterium]|nr:cytochrome c3 family protein [Acidobacteriota bacterium]